MLQIADISESEFREQVLSLIHREYGLGGLARFMMVFCSGRGDYTRDRYQRLDGTNLEQLQQELANKAA